MYFQTGIENEQIVQALASLPSFCIKKMETFKGFMCLEKSMYKNLGCMLCTCFAFTKSKVFRSIYTGVHRLVRTPNTYQVIHD